MLGHNPRHRTNLRKSELYGLRQIDGNNSFVAATFVEHPEDRYSLNPSNARRFSGGYLNDTCWDWSLGFQAISAKELDKLIEKHKASKPTGPKGVRVK